jgi:hypothetical protein
VLIAVHLDDLNSACCETAYGSKQQVPIVVRRIKKRSEPLFEPLRGVIMQRRKSVPGYVLLAVVALFTFGWFSFGQGQVIHPSVYGTVTDKTGAAIPAITVTDISRYFPSGVDQLGREYLAPDLLPDAYDIKASATGFRQSG